MNNWLPELPFDAGLRNHDQAMRRILKRLIAYWKFHRTPDGVLLPAAVSITQLSEIVGDGLSSSLQATLSEAALVASSAPNILSLNIPTLKATLDSKVEPLIRAMGQAEANMSIALRQVMVDAVTRRVPIEEAGSLLNRQLAKPVSNAKTLANTAIATIGRDAQLEAFSALRQVKDGGGGRLRPLLVYQGPRGGKIRPFCEALLGRALTLTEVQGLTNGQDLPVDRFCGGYNCRHSWTAVPSARAARAMGAKVGGFFDVTATLEDTMGPGGRRRRRSQGTGLDPLTPPVFEPPPMPIPT